MEAADGNQMMNQDEDEEEMDEDDLQMYEQFLGNQQPPPAANGYGN